MGVLIGLDERISVFLKKQVKVFQQVMSVTFYTTVGDIKVEIFCQEVPKTAENFLALCASGYYTGCLFHRNIKGFIAQVSIRNESTFEWIGLALI